MELYENSYRKKRHFQFGKNWSDFLSKITEENLLQARNSLKASIGILKGKTFVDVGCGSGIFSLAACQLGARVTSIDVDEQSIDCARYLKQKYIYKNWRILKESVLDTNLVRKLGKFDVVYSWGVLHHTGNMAMALENVSKLVKKDGVLYIAIYNDNKSHLLEGTSKVWLKIKRAYNGTGTLQKRIIEVIYTSYLIMGITVSLRNPIAYIRNYKSLRGMNFFTDIRDWLGGYPYEYATVDDISERFHDLGFDLKRVIRVRSLGCNEYLFKRRSRC